MLATNLCTHKLKRMLKRMKTRLTVRNSSVKSNLSETET